VIDVLLRTFALLVGTSASLIAAVIGYDTPGTGTSPGSGFGDPNSSTYAVVNNTLADVGGFNLNGVVEINAAEGCSGVLLNDGQSILTAAHCIDPSGSPNFNPSATIRFNSPGCADLSTCGGAGTYVVSSVADFFIDPSYIADSGALGQGNDLAVIRLGSPAPAYAAGYSLYTGSVDSSVFSTPLEVVGAGQSGKGSIDASNYPFGPVMRQGEANYSAPCPVIFGPSCTSDVLVALFNANSTLSNQVEVAPGDSGGPSFYNGQLIGIHDYDICADGAACSIADASSYWADTYVGGSNASWIESVEVGIPEPAAQMLLAIGLAGILLARRCRPGAPFGPTSGARR